MIYSISSVILFVLCVIAGGTACRAKLGKRSLTAGGIVLAAIVVFALLTCFQLNALKELLLFLAESRIVLPEQDLPDISSLTDTLAWGFAAIMMLIVVLAGVAASIFTTGHPRLGSIYSKPPTQAYRRSLKIANPRPEEHNPVRVG